MWPPGICCCCWGGCCGCWGCCCFRWLSGSDGGGVPIGNPASVRSMSPCESIHSCSVSKSSSDTSGIAPSRGGVAVVDEFSASLSSFSRSCSSASNRRCCWTTLSIESAIRACISSYSLADIFANGPEPPVPPRPLPLPAVPPQTKKKHVWVM